MPWLPRNRYFYVTTVVFVFYAALFIWRTSFVLDGVRYFSLFDDAMVSMRYAHNLAEGYGLVWNPGGERVEGFTNPAWVLVMAVFHMLPLSENVVSLAIQISSLLLLVINLGLVYFLVRKLLDGRLNERGKEWVALGAVALTAFYLPINNWSLQGMEVSILTMWMTGMTLWATTLFTKRSFSTWFYVLLGAATLIRFDMLVPVLVFWIFGMIFDPKYRVKHFVWGGLSLLIFVGGQTAARIWYYADRLPNTYYLKMTGFPTLYRITRGLYVTAGFIWSSNWFLFLLAFMSYLSHKRREVLLMIALLSGQIAYSVYVGGDAWEWWGGANRYVAIAMPLMMILLSIMIFGLVERLNSTVQFGVREHTLTVTARTVQSTTYMLAIVATLLTLNSFQSPEKLADLFLLRPPMHVNGNYQAVEQALYIRKITSEQATIGVGWAGATPYFARREAFDFLGKNDRYIARQEARIPAGTNKWTGFYPGHMKYDFDYSIRELKPDVIVEPLHQTDQALTVMATDYQAVAVSAQSKPTLTFYLRKDSEHILWEEIEKRLCQVMNN